MLIWNLIFIADGTIKVHVYYECNSAASSSNVLCYKKCFAESDFYFLPDLKHKVKWFQAQGYMVLCTELYGFKCLTFVRCL